jgi:fructose-bisphosphate aldolase class I
VGLDRLAERLKAYYERGARFAKWRAVIDISEGIPTAGAIRANAHALARYAALCQAAQIVPIVEPEVLMDGAHDIARCEEVTRFVLQTTFQELFDARVALRTIAVLKATTPSAVPGVAYLSGGQSDQDATAHLDAMNRIGGFPWKMTFSYGRALQAAPQKAWSGKKENVAAAQAAFAHRARMNGLASLGQWEGALEKVA